MNQYYCPGCGAYLSTFQTHMCPGRTGIPKPPPFQPTYIFGGTKCDICGSTATDHTENQCNMNRQFNLIADQERDNESKKRGNQ